MAVDVRQQLRARLRRTHTLGRAGSVLRLPNGATVSNNYWNHLFKELDEVVQFQVRLRPDGSLRLNFVGRPFAESREAWLRRVLGAFLGPMPIEIACGLASLCSKRSARTRRAKACALAIASSAVSP